MNKPYVNAKDGYEAIITTIINIIVRKFYVEYVFNSYKIMVNILLLIFMLIIM